MYNVTQDFLTAVKLPSRTVKAKVVIDGTTTLDESIIMNFSVEKAFSSNMPVLGSVSASKLTLSMINDGLPAVLVGVPIIPSVAIEVTPGVYEWLQLGTYFAEPGDITKTKRTTSIECFDKMPTYDSMTYTSTLSYPASLEAIKAEITEKHGISFAAQTLPAVTFAEAPIGTVRQVLAELALNLSRNCIVNATGLVEFVALSDTGFSLDGSHYIDFRLESEAPIKLSQISFKKGESVVYSGDGSGYAISIESSNITDQAAADTVYNRAYPLTYTAYTLKAQGMPHLTLGDKFTFTDVENNVRTLIVVNHKLSFSGGLVSEFTVDAPKAEVVESTPTGGQSVVSRAVTQATASMMLAVNEATQLITGAQGGVVKTVFDEATGKPEQQLIMDTDDIATATRVWRWNIEGLGYSSNGYLGPYSLAIRADGKINADFITVGTLNADVIQVNSISNDKLSIDLQGTINSKVSETTFDEVMGVLSGDLADNITATNSLQSDFNNLNVGGVNLIMNSRGNYGDKGWGTSGVAISGYSDATSVKFNGAGNVLRIGKSSVGSGYAYSDTIVLIPSTKYTVSGKYYVGSNAAGITVSVEGQRIDTQMQNSVYTHLAVTDSVYSNGAYKTFSATFTTAADEEKCYVKVEHAGSEVESFLYIVCKLEEGNKAGAWAPCPDDLTAYADDSIAASATAMSSNLQQTADSIMTAVSTDYYTKSDAEALESSMNTRFTQTSSDFLMLFNQVTEVQNADRSNADGKFTEIEKYIKFEDGDILLGEAGNQLTLRIENDRIAFKQDGTEVAYFSDRQLNVTDGQFINSLKIGNFGFVPRANGNLSFRRN
jgi:uncharacterized protein YxeA